MKYEDRIAIKVVKTIREVKGLAADRPVTLEHSLCDLGYNPEDIDLLKQALEDQFHIDDIDNLGNKKDQKGLFEEELPKIKVEDIISLITKW